MITNAKSLRRLMWRMARNLYRRARHEVVANNIATNGETYVQARVLTGIGESAETPPAVFDVGKVNFLSTGRLPPNPAELLVHDRFAALLEHAAETFDLVVIDTPQDARMVHRRMEQNGIRLDGVIFNDLSASASKYRYGGYYTYKYKKA